MNKVLKIIDFAYKKGEYAIAVFKPTGFGRFDLYEKLSSGKTLNEAEQEEWNRVVYRFDTVCKTAKEKDVVILIDAEESWMQDAADQLVTLMMKTYNTEKPIVYNTLQMYRHDRMVFLKSELQIAKKEGYYLGYKLVRGAYMEKENERAEKQGYISPICVNKQATDDNFNDAVQYMLSHLDMMSLFAGTHNENSSY